MRLPLSLLPLALLALFAVNAAAYRGSPPPGRAGDPPNGRTCQACHGDFALNSGDVALALIDEAAGIAFTSYEAGIAYDLRVELSSGESGRSRWGFELVPLIGETMAGELSAGPSSSLLSSGGRTYLAHSPAMSDPAGASWSFSWTAPPDDANDVLVWACGNAANGDSGTDGDYIECVSFLLTPGAPAGGAVTRLVRWDGEDVHAASAALGGVPCSTPSDGLRLCEETPLFQETVDGPLPLSVEGAGRLVFIEHDSDTAAPGSDDVLVVSKDPNAAGHLLVSLR
jgi:hypothetical protein